MSIEQMFGKTNNQAPSFQLESLILAQNER
jgi:hypothetical protein